MKLTFALKVFMSCKTIEQMSTAILWSHKILSKEDVYRFWHIAKHVPDADVAMQEAMGNHYS
jgi:hypothetical protein